MINPNEFQIAFLVSDSQLAIIAKKAAVQACNVFEANFPDSVSAAHLCAVAVHISKVQTDSALSPDYFQAIVARLLTTKAPDFNTADFHTRLVGLVAPPEVEFKVKHRLAIKSFVQIWLMLLRAEKALILPYRFTFPYRLLSVNGVQKRIEMVGDRRGSLLDFITSINDKDQVLDPALEFLPAGIRHMFAPCCSGYIQALGWMEPEDASLSDLFALRRAFNAIEMGKRPKALWSQLAQALTNKFKERLPFSLADFTQEYEKDLAETATANGMVGLGKVHAKMLHAGARGASVQRKVAEVKNRSLSVISPYAVAKTYALDPFLKAGKFPDGVACPSEEAMDWIQVERAFFAKTRMESASQHKGTIGHFNAYLFGYLFDWRQTYPEAVDGEFPSSPSKIKNSRHISRLMAPSSGPQPMTLIEFFEKLNNHHEWKPNTYYAKIKHLEQFFQFIEDHHSELPNCRGFKQPLGKLDFPRSQKLPGTNKGLLPRAVFGFVVGYIDALLGYMDNMLDIALARPAGLTDLSVERFFRSPKYVLAHFKDLEPDFGPAPSFEWKGKRIELEDMPNFFDLTYLDARGVLGGTEKKLLPRSHVLRHLSTALQTGIRGNHIQWLDLDSFDQYADDNEPFTKLWVNTDKFKNSGWTPYVAQSVIQGLRRQKLWRDAIVEPGFANAIPYNGNEKSKWGKFLPLFSFAASGQPHSDQNYSDTWKEILYRVQIEMRRHGFECPDLVRLLPATIAFDEAGQRGKLVEVSADREVVDLFPATLITPHSARVSIVSHLISALPAEFIGKHITGQTAAVVAYYTKLDPDYLHRHEQIQGQEADRLAHGKAFNDLMSGVDQEQFIHADGPASKLAESLKKHYGSAVSAFGCMSMANENDGQTGLDLLADSIGRNAVFNKTEICPHGNHCPSEIIKELKGRGRCGVCPRAVRSIDHLPAIAAKCRQMNEELMALDDHIEGHANLSESDKDVLENQRQMLAEELVGWMVALEVLDASRRAALANQSEAAWVAGKPAIIQLALQRVQVPTEETQYVLARLSEAQAYPNLQTPELKAKFDMLRRQIAARMGHIKEAFDLAQPKNPGEACAGMLRTFVQANNLSFEEVAELLNTNNHLAVPSSNLGLLSNSENGNDQ